MNIYFKAHSLLLILVAGEQSCHVALRSQAIWLGILQSPSMFFRDVCMND